MTAVDDRPTRRIPVPVSRADQYEYRVFLGSAAHCYPKSQLYAEWPPMVLPWCEEQRPWPFRHERSGIGNDRIAAPNPDWTCVTCGHLVRAANSEARRGRP